ncbi:prepilin peptidase CpaA [Pseudoduganella flava]|uniref:Prepilin peptidase n=1 Tax=Pseudoduganella flava TaxID=871742 RepID=A0A562PNN5_9BURK|nr:prepilin peptidase [Pseudoduganella flava]QGZ40628.1 prepilin peptidase [Pseudoduganella flava]TWI46081.1 prepilin peptidase CpaA [Pseudoduganella flava]
MNLALQSMLLWLMAQAAITDLALRRIPNVLVFCGLLIALLLHVFTGRGYDWLSIWLSGLGTGFFLFLPLYMLRGMAAGDVKLMAMTGAFVGPALTVEIAVLTCLIGGVLALLMVACSGRWRMLLRNLKVMAWPLLGRAVGYPLEPVPLPREASAGGIPYGVAIALGTTAVVLQPHWPSFA